MTLNYDSLIPDDRDRTVTHATSKNMLVGLPEQGRKEKLTNVLFFPPMNWRGRKLESEAVKEAVCILNVPALKLPQVNG